MEILQTIWTVLNTENASLAITICTPLIFLEMYLSMLLFTTILDIEANNKQKLTYIIILGLLGLCTVWILPAPFNSFLNVIACPILVYFIFKTNILKAILSEILPYIFFIIPSEFVVNIYSIVFKISNEAFSTTPIYKLTGSLIVYLFIYLIYRFIRYYKININIDLNIKNSRIANCKFYYWYYRITC